MLILSYYCLDDPLLKLLEQAEDAVRGDRGDTEEGKPCEHVAQKAGADAAVVVAASKVESRAGNQGQHEGLGDAPGLDQSLGLAKDVIKPQCQARIDHAEEPDHSLAGRGAGRTPEPQQIEEVGREPAVGGRGDVQRLEQGGPGAQQKTHAGRCGAQVRYPTYPQEKVQTGWHFSPRIPAEFPGR